MVLRWSRWVSRRQQSLNGKHYKVDCQLAATKGRIYKNIRILQNIRDRVNFVGKQPKCSIPLPFVVMINYCSLISRREEYMSFINFLWQLSSKQAVSLDTIS